MLEETGLVAPAGGLRSLGTFAYLRDKDLALFLWSPAPMPDPKSLSCSSMFTTREGASMPEFDRFGLFSWDEALKRVGKNLARILGALPEGARAAAAG